MLFYLEFFSDSWESLGFSHWTKCEKLNPLMQHLNTIKINTINKLFDFLTGFLSGPSNIPHPRRKNPRKIRVYKMSENFENLQTRKSLGPKFFRSEIVWNPQISSSRNKNLKVKSNAWTTDKCMFNRDNPSNDLITQILGQILN